MNQFDASSELNLIACNDQRKCLTAQPNSICFLRTNGTDLSRLRSFICIACLELCSHQPKANAWYGYSCTEAPPLCACVTPYKMHYY